MPHRISGQLTGQENHVIGDRAIETSPGEHMSEQSVMLKILLRERHWQNYSTFCAEYDKAARRIAPDLAGRYPSRAQLHRWLSGAVRSLPYADHCRVLEEMFPGWTAEQLFQPATGDRPQADGGPVPGRGPGRRS